MSRVLTVLGVALLWTSAGCIHPHNRYRTHHGVHGSVHVGGQHRAPAKVVHSHGAGCGHVLVGVEWVLRTPGTSHGVHAPPPTSGTHARGLHSGQVVASPGKTVEKSHGKAKGKGHGKTDDK